MSKNINYIADIKAKPKLDITIQHIQQFRASIKSTNCPPCEDRKTETKDTCNNHVIAEKWFTANMHISATQLPDDKQTKLKDAIQKIASLKLCSLVDNDFKPINKQAENIEQFLDGTIAVTFPFLCEDRNEKAICREKFHQLFKETDTLGTLSFFNQLFEESCHL